MNRNADGRSPGVVDIKGSGAFEEDADVIIMLYRENFSKDSMELIVNKNRVTGNIGTIDVQINSTSSKIENLGW